MSRKPAVPAFGLSSFSYSPRIKYARHKCSMNETARSSAAGQATEGSGGVNINKFKSQRSILSTDKRELAAEEVNSLMIRAGKGVS